MIDFSGFPQAMFDFLAELGVNNNRDWFEANTQTYQDAYVTPAVGFIAALGPRLQDTISTGIQYDLRANGSGSLMRIYRDVRFSRDKTPYKLHLDMAFWEGSAKKMRNPIFGVRIEATGGGMMVGMHGFDKTMLNAYRKAVDDDKLGADLENAVTNVTRKGDYAIGGAHYKRVPRGFDTDHPRSDLLRHNGLYAYSPPLSPDQLTSPDVVDICLEHCVNMVPIHRWLVQLAG